jgi:hypothetical protein
MHTPSWRKATLLLLAALPVLIWRVAPPRCGAG